ncbi:unnamed protein product, partial [Leptidea sinapis]
MHVNVTETPVIPYEVDRYYVFGSNRARVTVVGDVVGPLFPTMPESGEQNMFSFAANMYLTMYMRLINQRNRTLEREAFNHMNVLYQRQMSFMKPDGSFSLFRSDWNQSSSSVWLTSFCAKVISMAVSFVLEHQTPEGAFYEVTWLPDRNANSTIIVPKDSQLYREAGEQLKGEEVNNSIVVQRNITLTAQVIITLESVKNLKDIGIAEQLGVAWLERHLRLLSEWAEPYALAVVAYALTCAKAPSAEHAYRLLKRRQRSEGGLVYWGKEAVPPPPYKMENQKPFLLPRLPYDNNEAIVMWLNAQRLRDGGWASTQYTNRKRLRDVSALTVTVDAVALNGSTKTLHVRNDELGIMQSVD